MKTAIMNKKEKPVLIRLIVIFASLACFLSVPLAGAQNNAPAKNRTAITAIIHHDYVPTCFQDPKTNKAAGFAVDVMDEIAGRAGFAVSYRFEYDWTAIVDAVRTGKADIAPGMGITAERQKVLALTLPIDTVPISMFVRSKSNSNISELKNGISVGVIKGSAAYEILKKKHDNISFRTFKSFAEGLFDLLAGHIDVFCCPTPTLMQLARDSGVEDKIKIVGEPVMELKIGIALRKDDVELIAKLNAVIKDFVGSPEYQRIYKKWYGTPTPYWTSRKIVTVGAIVFFVLICSMFVFRYITILGFNRELKKAHEELEQKVDERTYELGMANEELEHEIGERIKTEATLSETNTMLRTLIQAMPDQVFFKDSEGRFLLANKAAEQATGCGPEKLIGKTNNEILPPDTAEMCNRSDAEALKRGHFTHAEEHMLDKDGSLIFLDTIKAPIYGARGELLGLLCVARDITERKQMEETLRESEKHYRTLFDNSPLCIHEIDMDGRLSSMNKAGLLMMYMNEESEVRGRLYLDMVSPADRERIGELLAGAYAGGACNFEFRSSGRSGRILKSCFVPIRNIKGDIEKIMGITEDITERKRLEDELKESEASIRQLIENAPIAMVVEVGVEADEKLIMANKKFTELFGYTLEDVSDVINWWPLAYPEEKYREEVRMEWIEKVETAVRTRQEMEPMETTVTCKDGSTRYIKFYLSPIGNRNLITFENLTERKKAEEQTARSLREKETLLREIHHRVKNNMAVVSSLLSLQVRQIEDATVRTLFEESQQRVQSMALVHEKLYQTKDLSVVNFEDYIKSIVSEIISLYRIDTSAITTEINIKDIELDIETAVPCGLIINELLTNAFKYAFPDSRNGVLSVHFTKTDDDTCTLVIKDNGVGLPKGFDYKEAKTLGLQLVNVLTGQLRGTLQIKSDKGTESVVTFPNSRGLCQTNEK
jgi:PAS domain S-box-containing protein